MKTHLFLMYGQGGGAVDAVLSGDGLGYIQKLADAMPDVVAHDPLLVYDRSIVQSAFTWDAGQAIYDEAQKIPVTDRLIIGGVSLGANVAPYVASVLRRPVELIFGIQPSMYGPKNLVSSNIRRAVCIYNPIWFMTGGLGAYYWRVMPGNSQTEMLYQYSYWPHPGDNNSGVRNRVLQEIKAVATTKGG